MTENGKRRKASGARPCDKKKQEGSFAEAAEDDEI
jgi:hypothetical protein